MILVTIQYRLGVFGFLNTWSDSGFTKTNGNYGMLDQQMAINFVRQNAINIGGDSSRITIFGESAGAESVGFQLLSDTCDMISGAIHQSGTAFFDGTNQYSHHVNEYIRDLGRIFVPDLANAEPDMVVDILRPINSADILYADSWLANSERINNPVWF